MAIISRCYFFIAPLHNRVQHIGMIKNTAYMALSTIARLMSAVVLFVILARLLGPAEFGLLMYNFTLGSIAILLVEYGFSNQLLRDIGKTPELIHQIMGRVFLAKLLLTAFLIVLCLIGVLISKKTSVDVAVFWLLLLSFLFTSFGDFFNVAFRGIGKFHEETKVATIGSLLHFGLILLLVFNGAGLIVISVGFVISKVVYCLLSWRAYKQVLGGMDFKLNAIYKAVATLKAGFPYAADAGVTNFFYQVDTIMVKHFLGFASLGIYQAANKWLQGGMQFAPVLANVYIPAIANKVEDANALSKVCNTLNTKMLIVGILGGLFFTIFGGWLANYVYGNEYVQTNTLWYGVGFLMFLRYLSGAQGTILIAFGFQKTRVMTQVFAILLLGISAPYLVVKLGVIGMVIALQINVFFVFLIYFITLAKNKQPTGFNAIKSLICGLIIFVGALSEFNANSINLL